MGKVSLNDEYFASYIGKKIKQFREESGRTRTEVARYLDKSRTMFSNYEKGRNNIALSDLYKLAFLFNRPLADFLPSEKPPPRPSLKNSLALLLSKDEAEKVYRFIMRLRYEERKKSRESEGK